MPRLRVRGVHAQIYQDIYIKLFLKFYVQDSVKQDIYLIQIIILNSNNIINETIPCLLHRPKAQS